MRTKVALGHQVDRKSHLSGSTSLADRAWGAESAVYRVAGVMNVIGGWFLTALSALLVSGSMAFVFYRWGIPAITTLFGLAALLFIRSQLRFMQKRKQA